MMHPGEIVRSKSGDSYEIQYIVHNAQQTFGGEEVYCCYRLSDGKRIGPRVWIPVSEFEK